MATVTFLIKGSGNPTSIYVRLGVDRTTRPQVKTGFTINPKQWSKTKGLPIDKDANTKKIKQELTRLESSLIESLNTSQSEGETINSKWLKKCVSKTFNREKHEEDKSNLVTDYLDRIIELAPTKIYRGKVGLSPNRIKGYQTTKSLIENYEKYRDDKLKLNDIDLALANDYNHWMLKVENYSESYSGRQLAELKTICNNANKEGYIINEKYIHITGYEESKDDRFIVTLSFDELKKIKDKHFEQPHLINAKNWLLIGCEIGQRFSDLIKLKKENFRVEGDILFVDITQKKTGKEITAVVINEYVKDIILNNMPHQISAQNFNDYIKDVCRLSELEEIVEGKKMNSSSNRKEKGKYPKHDIISSHSCRRSFATNFYKKIPTPILMEITGHSKESDFLSYINQKLSLIHI